MVNLILREVKMYTNFNTWHHVSPGNKETLPDIVNGIIEIPKGTRAKYELDKESGLLRLDRVLYSSVYYRIPCVFVEAVV